jgi:hypothetical protein
LSFACGVVGGVVAKVVVFGENDVVLFHFFVSFWD